MPRFKFAKLVRDKIVDHQIASGARPTYYQLTEQHYQRELIKKIVEEAREVLKAEPEAVASEIADVQQALDDLKSSFKLTTKQIRTKQLQKKAQNGAFKRRLFIEYVDLNDTNEWTAYYREHSDRYPELPES